MSIFPHWAPKRKFALTSFIDAAYIIYAFYIIFFFTEGKDLYSPDAESSPAPSSTEPQMTSQGGKQTSRTSSFEIENLLKTAEQVINFLEYIYFSKFR